MALEWIGKQTHKASSDSEVSITINKTKGKCQQMAYRFRNNSALRITKTGFIEFAFANDRIYFRESNKFNGYTLTSVSSDGKNCGFKTNIVKTDFIGDYDLLFDKEERLNYIDFNKKK